MVVWCVLEIFRDVLIVCFRIRGFLDSGEKGCLLSVVCTLECWDLDEKPLTGIRGTVDRKRVCILPAVRHVDDFVRFGSGNVLFLVRFVTRNRLSLKTARAPNVLRQFESSRTLGPGRLYSIYASMMVCSVTPCIAFRSHGELL